MNSGARKSFWRACPCGLQLSRAIFSAISWSEPAMAGINQSIKMLQDRALKTFTERTWPLWEVIISLQTLPVH